jgi:hypothetical protein
MTDLEVIFLVGALSTLIVFTMAPSAIIYLVAFMVLAPVLGALLFAVGGLLLDAALSIRERSRARRSVQTTLDEIGESESN